MIKKKWAILYETNRGQWFLAAAGTTVLYILICIMTPVVFNMNDDTNIMYTLSGYYTGTPADDYFIGIFLSWLLQGLYRLLPALPWYGIAQVCAVAVSVTVINKALLFRCHRRGLSPLVPLTILLCLGALVFYPAGALIQFTVTSSMLGAAACAFLLCADAPEMAIKHRLLHVVGSGFFLLASFSFRLNSGKSACCFYGVCLLVVLVRYLLEVHRAKKNSEAVCGDISRKKFMLLAVASLCSLVLAFTSPIVSNLIRSTPQWQTYFAYETARVQFTDYPHVKYDEAPSVYESVGWDESLYNLAGRSLWFFMDERIDTQQFETICSATGDTADATDSGNSAQTVTSGGQPILSMLKKLWLNNDATPAGSLLMMVVGCFFLANLVYKPRKEWLSLLGAFASLGGGAVMVLFLAWKGRLPLRAFQAILIPCAVVSILLLVDLLDKIPIFRREAAARPRILLSCAALLCAIAMVVPVVGETRALVDSKIERSAYTLSLEDYALQHPDSLYVYDVGLTFRYMPFVTYPQAKPTNVIFWGGMGYRSPAFYQQLALNGISELYCDQFLNTDKDIFYVTRDDYEIYSHPVSDFMLAYMDATYGSLGMCQVDTVGDHVRICRFLPAIDLTAEDGWVELYGVRYYIQNHALASGTVDIDGETYQFEEISRFQQVTYEGQTYWLNLKGSPVGS